MSLRSTVNTTRRHRPRLPPSKISSLILPPLLIPVSFTSNRPITATATTSSISKSKSRVNSRPTTPSLPSYPAMSDTTEAIPEVITRTRAAASGQTGESVEPRQTLPTEDMEPNPSKSFQLPPNRQKLVDDVIMLYSCQPTIERVARYAPGKRLRSKLYMSKQCVLIMRTKLVYTMINLCMPMVRHIVLYDEVSLGMMNGRSLQDGRTMVWSAQVIPRVGESRL